MAGTGARKVYKGDDSAQISRSSKNSSTRSSIRSGGRVKNKREGFSGEGQIISTMVDDDSSSSSISSLSTRAGENTTTYDTPETSAAVTPAEPIRSRQVTAKSQSNDLTSRVNPTLRALELRNSQWSLGAGSRRSKKRKAGASNNESGGESDDLSLARQLQQEEYNEGSDDVKQYINSRPRVSKRARLTRSTVDKQELTLENDYSALKSSAKSRIQVEDGGTGVKTSVKRTRVTRQKNVKYRGFCLEDDSADDDEDEYRDSDARSEVYEEAIEDSDAGSEVSFKPRSKGRSRAPMTHAEAARLRWISRGGAENGDNYSDGASESDEREKKSKVKVIDKRTKKPVPEKAPKPTARGPMSKAEAIRHSKMDREQKERNKLEWQHPEILTMWKELADEPVIEPQKAKQPEAISRQLKPFQLEGLNWMIRQEKTHWKGGLLGDEMGMGKTIQAVSLIMSDWPAKNPTLVIVPPVALMQWQSEINAYTDGKLKVLVHHGTNPKSKGLTVKDVRKFDVIMISYSSLESMHRKERKGWSRKDIDGEDVLIKEDSLLHCLQWHRVILDEAHNIKSRTSGVAKACFALNADHKWCLSGTPLQNRIAEFFSLLRFLDVTPFACYMCKSCSCTQLHWSVTGESRMCQECNHSSFNHVSVFNQEILDDVQKYGNSGRGKIAFDKLRLLTDRLMLRRNKRDHTASMELPPKDIILSQQFFGEIEHDFANSIMTNTNRQFDTYVSQRVVLNNYANIFGLIMQMRQVADHPDLILKKNAEGGQNILICVVCDEPAEDAIRSDCRHDFCRNCAKNFMQSFEGSGDDADCPRCHIPLAIDLTQPEREQDEVAVKKSSIINRIKMDNWTSSTKIELLVSELYNLRSSKRTEKSIVFSQFTSMLQLVEWRLRRVGFKTVMLDGTMSPAQRQSSIKYFMENVDVEVFLVSLKAGGVALNLTEASRVFLVDPWWNPAAEWQSADRCHRIGQRRPCIITRLIIEDSVESRIVALQEKKANMINFTINADEGAMANLTPEDMMFLFRG